MIAQGSDVNAKAKNGLTPIHLCAQEDKTEVARLLVDNGGDCDCITKAGYTPLHVASHFGQVNIDQQQSLQIKPKTFLDKHGQVLAG